MIEPATYRYGADPAQFCGHLGVWAAGRAGLPDGAPGAHPGVAVTGVVSQGGVLALADCARDRLDVDAAVSLMGGEPDELPEAYRLGSRARRAAGAVSRE
jgi:hypothetical protein